MNLKSMLISKQKVLLGCAILIVICCLVLYKLLQTADPQENSTEKNMVEAKAPIPAASQSNESNEITPTTAHQKIQLRDKASDHINRPMPSQGDTDIIEEDLDDEVAVKIADFEADVLDNTHTLRIRVETPELLEAKKSGLTPGPAPGYVAFMAAPEAFEEGVFNTMQDIARHYFNQFPGAPRVTVSLVIGGGVKDHETFFINEDGTVGNKEPVGRTIP
jgi:hypothetical protein